MYVRMYVFFKYGLLFAPLQR